MSAFQIEKYWCGSEDSYAAYLAENKHAENVRPVADMVTADNGEPPRLFSRMGDIGVVAIHGSLTNSNSWFDEMLGRSTYPAIRDALIHAATNSEVKAIILDVNSGGGAVSGVSDTADLISRIDKNVKPVHTFSDGQIASAAYWLGSSARSVNVGAVTDVGSIGVIVTHTENSKMLADIGIKATVIRSGPYKAIGHSAEELTPEGKAIIQAQVDQLAGMFTEHVAHVRGMPVSQVDAQAGQGRVFIGKSAVDVGLADSVTTFDALAEFIQRGIDSAENRTQYPGNLPKGIQLKTALTQQQIALMAAGVLAAQAETLPTVPVAETAPTAATPAPTTATAPAQAPEQAPAASSDAVVTLLQGQLATAQAQVVALSVDLQAAKAANQATAHQADLMRPIVRASLGNMRVALGGTAAGVETLSDDALLAEHTNVSAQFNAKFKAGGVAAVSSSASSDKAESGVDELRRQARIRATRTTTSK